MFRFMFRNSETTGRQQSNCPIVSSLELSTTQPLQCTFRSTTNMNENTDNKNEDNFAKRHHSMRRASMLAEQSIQCMVPKSATEYVQMKRSSIEFQIIELQSQLELLNSLVAMEPRQKVKTLFDLLDDNNDSHLDGQELASGLRKVHGESTFVEALNDAIDQVVEFDEDGDGKLDVNEFGNLVQTLADGVDCTSSEIAEMMIMENIFSADKPKNPAADASMSSEDAVDIAKKEYEYRKGLTDERMVVLFEVFDVNKVGIVDFKDVVMGLYKLTENFNGVNEAAVTSLLLFDENDDSRTLDYMSFTRLIVNVVAASPNQIKFADVADAMTRSAAAQLRQEKRPSADDLYRFSMDKSLNKSLRELIDMSVHEDEKEALNENEYCKLYNLFVLWDLDQDGSIDFQELLLALRKFEEKTDLYNTVEETISIMNKFDEDGDQQLAFGEFASFIAKFASMSDLSLLDLVDSMIVATAIRENSKEDVDFSNSIGKNDIEYWNSLSSLG